jgi:hypothetical protein
MDPRIKNRDSGIAFMRAYFLVKPRAVAILHPMSYLVKPTIYDRLVNFGYRLENCVIFSSRAFATHGSNAFPYVAALWVPVQWSPHPATAVCAHGEQIHHARDTAPQDRP